MPETVKLGDRYWLVRTTDDLDPDEFTVVMDCFERMTIAHGRDDMEMVYDEAVTVVSMCLIDDVDTSTIKKLSLTDLGNLMNTIENHYDTRAL